MSQKIIFDTDPGVDDAMAIQFLLNSPEIEILGLTTVFGNVDLEKTTANALRLLESAERTDIPVAKGAEKPMTRSFGGGVPFVYGDDGMGNTFREPSKNVLYHLSATDFIAEQVKRFPNEVTLLAVGPLTNLALFIQKYDDLIPLVKEVIIMGGNAFSPGNATPAAEANILNDPEAADMVFATHWKVSMIGLDVTHKVLMSSTQLDEIASRSSEMNKYVSEAMVFYHEFYRTNNKIAGIFVHDSSAVAYLLNRELFTVEAYPLKVETTNSISFGKTWPLLDEEPDFEERPVLIPWQNRPKVNICVDVNAEAVLKLIMERLN
jgi:inosine-uridine nucleoside N-ribohydrolase